MSILPIVQQALLAGFGEEQILSFIGNRIPGLAKGINQAKKSGFDPAKILRFLSYSMPRSNSKHIEQQKNVNDRYLSGIGLKTKEEREEQRNKLLKGALGVGAGVLGAAQLLKPNQAQSNPGPQPMANAPVQPSQQQPLAQPQQQPLAQPQQQPVTQKPSINSSSIINQMGLSQQIQTLKSAGNTPEAIAAAVGTSMKPNQRKWLDEQIKAGTAKPLPDMIQEFVSQPSEENPSPAKPKTQISKDEFVALPSGDVGRVQDIKKSEALVEEGGKLHRAKISHLIASPLPPKDLAKLFDDLIQGIEEETEEEVSKHVEWSGYNQDENLLAYIPHGGGLYIYPNISPEDAKFLTNAQNTRKTSGNNYIGAWIKGTKSPIGAAMSALIKRLQNEREGKGKEYLLKFPTVYRALGPAHEAKKEAEKKRRKPDER